MLVDTIAVGRDPRCDVNAADPRLSRRHAEFAASGPTVVVRDLNSRNGILVNGRRLTEAVLHPGDVVQIAQLVVTFLSNIETETVFAPAAVHDPGAAPPPAEQPGDETTCLLSAAEIQAVAAASAAGRSQTPDAPSAPTSAPADRQPANGSSANGNGARRSGGWSVQLVADDDRTKLVPPALLAAGDASTDPEPAPLAESRVAPPGDRPLPATMSGPAIDVPPEQDRARVTPPSGAAREAAVVAVGRSDALKPRSHTGITARTLGLAIVCFAFGVASTMIWLQPPLTVDWLLLEHVPVAVAAAFVVILVVGGLAGFAISRTAGRMESN